jgi:hypothetical protein
LAIDIRVSILLEETFGIQTEIIYFTPIYRLVTKSNFSGKILPESEKIISLLLLLLLLCFMQHFSHLQWRRFKKKEKVLHGIFLSTLYCRKERIL